MVSEKALGRISFSAALVFLFSLYLDRISLISWIRTGICGFCAERDILVLDVSFDVNREISSLAQAN
jgi:hypothetical protein